MITDLWDLVFDHLTPRTLGLLSRTCKHMEQKVNTAWRRQAELIFGVEWDQIVQMTEVVHCNQVYRVPRTAKEIVRFETEDTSRIYGWETWMERDLLQAHMDAVSNSAASDTDII